MFKSVIFVSAFFALALAAPIPDAGSAYSGVGGQANGGSVHKSQRYVCMMAMTRLMLTPSGLVNLDMLNLGSGNTGNGGSANSGSAYGGSACGANGNGGSAYTGMSGRLCHI